MKQILSLSLSLILVINFSGCAKYCDTFCEPKIIEKTVYIKQPIPELSKKPKILDLQVQYVEFKDKTYVMMTKEESLKLVSNWESYRSWAEENYNILEVLKK